MRLLIAYKLSILCGILVWVAHERRGTSPQHFTRHPSCKILNGHWASAQAYGCSIRQSLAEKENLIQWLFNILDPILFIKVGNVSWWTWHDLCSSFLSRFPQLWAAALKQWGVLVGIMSWGSVNYSGVLTYERPELRKFWLTNRSHRKILTWLTYLDLSYELKKTTW